MSILRGVDDKDYQIPFKFEGTIDKLTYRLKFARVPGPLPALAKVFSSPQRLV